ncbi:ABC transporter G family member 32 [Phytophthora rubi]|uniref:ABC transporter G family member 32 n=1 Tax=Phytophthora rubi TaxID=129364 RepID=A0A6A3NFN0_9STRA|nr:ABC transporter G family member 32 [Phytophthora rubi]KAE9348553.1 ABC transporter G family member 32 [Phytophthora rubi]
MPTARRSARNSKRRPSSSRKSRPPPSMEFSTSVSSVSSEPTPILESSLASSYQKHVLRRHQPTSRTSRRPGPRDSPFTPRRPVGAVPELFVTFRHVSLAVDIPVSPAAAAAAAQAASGQMGRETLAAKQLPTISNHVRGIAAGLTASKTFVRRQILKNVTAAFTPGSMTLLLGRSGSGKSVLLKLLGGRLDVRANGVTTDGEVSYNGLTRQELKQQLPQCVAYVPQQDTHLPVMTVKETLDFAFECCAINAGARPVGSVSKSPSLEHPLALPTTYLGGERDPVTVTRELGLTRCQGTIVGDERLRGVSGGEKKRVTTGEMAFGPHAVSLMDEITTGLDSSAAFDVVNAQRRLARQQRQTVVISLQQPAPEVLALFDNVLLLADGEVLYHGPRAHIQAYFEALGFVCPPERGLADFLCDLASPQQLQYERSHAPMPGRRRHPRSANEFADLWIMSPMYEAMVEELDHLDNDTETYSHTHSKNGERGLYFDQEALLQVPPFRQSYLRSTWTVMKRQLRLFVRNKVFFAGRVLLDLLVGLMLGSMYYGMDLADSQVTLGVVFSCTLFLGLGQSATLAPFFDAREVFYKHRGANFYRTSSYVLASYASQLPLAVTEALLFSGLVYWMGGFVSSVEHFLVFVLYMLLTILVFIGEYFFLAAACSSLHVAQPASTLALLFFILFAGFAVSREQLPSAMRWIYWSNPLAWATRGVLVSQYRSSELDVCVYGGIDYCKTYEGQTLGEYSLGLYDVPSDPKWVMLGLVFLLAVYVGSMLLSYVMLEYRRHESSPALPPPLPASYSDTIPTPRQPKESYAMLSTPHGEDDELLESDITGFLPPDGRILGANGDSSDSFNASQGVHTDPGDIMVRLMPRWEVPPVTLAFQDLRYSITVPADAVSEGQSGVEGAPGRPVSVDSRAKAGKSKEMVTRELLKGVTGYALPGTMTALMGSTGAGKTTLMDVLAGRKSGKGGAKKNGAPCLRGRVLLNGVDATELAVRRCTGYCEQTDVHSDASTFREALQFSAYLRQGDRVAPERVEEIVDECLDLLGLSDVAGQLIRGSSSEQLKRLTLGVELAAQPSVLFLDEPTSGLDARAAKSLMDGVRKVADSGRTVICTIHQPSTEVFLLFDSLLLLQRGGETVFFGELGPGGEALVSYFQGLGLPRSAPTFKPGDNPATWMLDVIGAGVEKTLPKSTLPFKFRQPAAPVARNPRLQQLDASQASSVCSDISRLHQDDSVDFVAAYKASRLKQRLDAKRAAPGMFMPSDRVSPVTFAQRRAASDGLQFAMLLRRFTRLYWRTPFYTFTRMVTAFTLGLMFGLVYSGSNDFTSYQGANGAVGLIFFSTCFLGVGAYVHVLPLAFEERGPFYRERASETYSALWYFAASSVVEIPCAALASLIFVGVFYPMAGFSAHGDFAQVVVYWLVLTVHILFQTYFGQFFTFAMPSIELAAVWGSLFDSIFLMFMGYNPPVSSIPDGYKWLFQIVPHRYTFEVLTALVLGDCPDAQLQQIQDAAASNTTIDVSQWPLGCQPLTDAPPAVANIPLTSYIDAVFGARREDTARSVAVVVGVLLAMRAATLIVMRVVNHQKR